LPDGRALIFCADDPGAVEVEGILKKEGLDIDFTPYGFNADGDFRIKSYNVDDERVIMQIEGFPGELKLRIPGRHNALNATAALALTDALVKNERAQGWTALQAERVRWAMEDFNGAKRRNELIGSAGGVLFMDDYAHHPTAVSAALSALKEFYPKRRLILSFMSHTYTRTAHLLDEFAASFERADIVLLHKIYSSARELYAGGVTGRTLFEKTKALKNEVYYIEEPLDSLDLLKGILSEGDLFLTMGAGDNWKLSEAACKLWGHNRGMI
jgi:UDP-N-acetylmuramate--alanine ligase